MPLSDVFDNVDEDIWTTRTGQRIAVRDMTDSHLKNARAWVQQQIDEIRYCDQCDGCGRDAISEDLCSNCQTVADKKRLAWGADWLRIFDAEFKRRTKL